MRQVLSKLGLPSLLVVIVGTLAFAQPKPLAFTFTATLSGENVASPVETTGSGTVIAVLVGNELTVTGVFQDLGSNLLNIEGFPGVRIGVAPAGEEASEVEKLTAEQSVFGNLEAMTLTAAFARSTRKSGTFSGVFTLTDEQIEALGDDLFYVQLYTALNAGGELRGQLDASDLYDAYREYLAALEDPDVVHDATAADLVGIWRDTANDALWQVYENGIWTGLDSLAEAGRPNDNRWEFGDNLYSVAWGNGSQVELTVLYKDGRRRYLVVESQGTYSEPVGSWHEQVLIDEQGTRVNLR